MTSINPDTTDIEVTQADRKAAASALGYTEGTEAWKHVVTGGEWGIELSEAFARHRLSSKGIEPPMSPPAIAPAPCPFEEVARQVFEGFAGHPFDGEYSADRDYLSALVAFGKRIADLAKRGAELQREIATEQGASYRYAGSFPPHHVICTPEGDVEQGASVQEGEAGIPMLLNCPICTVRHIDEGDFAGKPHHTHACQGCGHVWRPAKVNTVGVQYLPGYKSPTPSRIAPTEQEILELAREGFALWVEQDAPDLAAAGRAGDIDNMHTITSRVSVLTLAVKRGGGK